MRPPLLATLVLWCGLTVVPAQSGGRHLAVLAPGDGFRSSNGLAWLVVRASGTPRATLDGRPLGASDEPTGDVYHWRVGPLRPAGSRLEVEAAGKRVVLTLYGVAGAGATSFHSTPPKACLSCHESGFKSCGECHRWSGTLHEPARKGECESCHGHTRPLLAEVAALCRRCHPREAGGRHPGLRHPVSAPQDPARPGRPFDCTSCHDPHAPAPLGRLTQEQQQRWCKGCHRR